MYYISKMSIGGTVSQWNAYVLETRVFSEFASCVDLVHFQEGRVNGLLSATRVVGASFLNPFVIPEPAIHSVELIGSDELLIVACAGLWLFVSYEEAAATARRCSSPSRAAKTLRDLAQAYGSQVSIGIGNGQCLISELLMCCVVSLTHVQEGSAKT